jgi:ribonuclease P/MRP protein subunit POP1
LDSMALDIPSALLTVKGVLIQRGSPKDCARIYRLPRDNPQLLAAWLSLIPANSNSVQSPRPTRPPMIAAKSVAMSAEDLHVIRGELAHTLLTDLSLNRKSGNLLMPAAGDIDYPTVPDEEDLIGFLTTGNFSLTEGKSVGIGNLHVGSILKGVGAEERLERLCIIRDSGMGLGRLARWEICE